MRIDNNYTQYRQPNFGRLKSTKYNNIYPDVYAEEIANLLRTIKESKAFNEFFNQYDLDIYFSKGEMLGKDYFSMTLKTEVPNKINSNTNNPILFFSADQRDDETICPTQYLINRLARKIKDIEFSDLKYKLDSEVKKLEEEEKNTQKYRAEIDDITNSLISQNLPEGSKKKTFFEKLFGWLK